MRDVSRHDQLQGVRVGGERKVRGTSRGETRANADATRETTDARSRWRNISSIRMPRGTGRARGLIGRVKTCRSRGSNLRRCGARTSREPWIERAGPSPREAVSRGRHRREIFYHVSTPEYLSGRTNDRRVASSTSRVFQLGEVRAGVRPLARAPDARGAEDGGTRDRRGVRGDPNARDGEMGCCTRCVRAPIAARRDDFLRARPAFLPLLVRPNRSRPPERRRPRDADRDRASFSSFARAARPRRTAAGRSSRARVRPASTASTRTTSAWRTSSWTPSRRWTTRPRRRGRA